MPDPVTSPELIIQDFSDSVHDLRNFVLESKKRLLEDSQRKVLMKNKLGRLKLTYNALIGHMTMESEARSKVLFDSIPVLTDVINSTSNTGIFELIWLELSAMINSLASALIALHSQGDIWSIQGSATLLIQIIGGLPKIDHLPSLLNAPVDDPEYLDRWIVTFNCLQLSAATYMGVVYAIKTVNLSDLIFWTNQSYFYLSLLNKFFEIYEWEKIATILKKRPQTLFNLTLIMCSAFQNLIEHSFLLIKLLGTTWPTEIETLGLFDDRSLGGFLNLIRHVTQINQKALEKVNELFKNGMWTINDNPLQTQPIKDLIDLNKIYDYYSSYIETLKIIEPEFQKLTSNSNNEVINTAISTTLTLNEKFLTFIEQQVGSRDNVLSSPLGTQFIDVVEQRLELFCLLAVCKSNPKIILVEFENLTWLFESAKPTQFSNLFIKKLFIELYIFTKFPDITYLEKIYKNLPAILESLILRPRDFSAILILESILGVLLEKKPIPMKDDILIKINKNGLINSGDYHLYNEFQEYIDYLIQVFKSEDLIFSEPFLTRKTFFNITDSMTWLIPDFNVLFKSKLPIPLYYLPFNRYCDGIVNIDKINR